MKKLFRKKGFTLVEVLVATVITMVLLGSVMAVFSSTRTVLADMKTDPFSDRIQNTVSEYIRRSMEKANGYRIAGAKQADVKTVAANILSNLSCGTGEKTHCLIISNVEGNYRLYDLGVVTSSTIDTQIGNLTNYNVFNAEYYDNMSCKLAFTEFIIDSRIEYMGITVQLCSSDGTELDKPTSNYFKILNQPGASSAQITTAGVKDISTAYPDSDSCIVIIYRIKDYTTT